MSSAKLYLIPTVIASATEEQVIPEQVRVVLKDLRYFLAEDVRTARRYLSSLRIYPSIEDLHFDVLDKDTGKQEISELMAPLMAGHAMGVLSESGCPGVADPGALAVRFAHEKGIAVVPLVGPSSILLALMASGLTGQRFAFHGYLPIQTKDTVAAIRSLEKESAVKDQTQIFIETPYRSDALFRLLVKTLRDDTRLTVAVNLTSPEEDIRTMTVGQWKSTHLKLAKVPVVFLFGTH